MNILPIIHLFCFIFYVYLSAFVLVNNPKVAINRVCAALIACYSLWSLGSIFLHWPHTPKNLALSIENLIAVGWVGFPLFFLWFSMLFSTRTTGLRRWGGYLMIFVPPLILLQRQWAGHLVSDLSLQTYGWAIVWSSTPWPFIYFVYVAVFISWGLFLILRQHHFSEDVKIRKHIHIIVAATLLVLPIGATTNIVLPMLGVRFIPDLADVPAVIWAFGLVYAMLRYRFLTITPNSAAEDIVSTMSDGLVLVDAHGRIVVVNQAIERLLGYRMDELRGQSLAVLLPEDSPIIGLAAESRHDHVFENIEINLRYKTGRSVPILFSSSTLEDDLGELRGTVCICTDITARKKIEKELASSEDRFQTVFEFAPDPYFIYDLKGTLIEGNRAAENLIGYKKVELIGKNLLKMDLLPKNQLATAAAKLAENALGKASGPTDFTLVHKDGSFREVEIHSFPVEIKDRTVVLGLARDITERKEAERELNEYKNHLEELVEARTGEIRTINRQLEREIRDRKATEQTLRSSREMFKTLTENVNVGIYRNTIGPRGKFIEANPALLRMFRFQDKEEFLARPISSFYEDPTDRKRLSAKILAEGFVKEEEINLKRRDGLPFVGSVSAVLVKDSQGKKRYFDGIIEDITVKKRLEEQLRQSQKMEAVGRLSGGIAHDFNNLLTSIIGYTEISRMKLDAGHPIDDHMKQILKAADHAKDLIQQLLAFSRKAMIQPRVINLNLVVSNFKRILQRVLGENIQLVFSPKENLGNVKIDPSQVEQIIMNLAVNSRDAMPEGGRLSIDSENTTLDQDTLTQHPYIQPGPYILLSVTDNGFGMVKEELSHIFEPFFTTKKKSKGTGLGLSTVYGIVKQNDGYINVYSEQGKGTTVKIYLPRVDEPADALEPKDESTPLPRGEENILVVEDEDAVREITVKVLMECGYEVMVAADGEEALRIWDEKSPRIDLLLTDVVLPTMNGLQLAKKMKLTKPSLKVLFMSGYSEDVVSEHRESLAEIDFLQKPFTSSRLAKKIRAVLDG